MNFLYLLVDLCSISIPLIASFHPRIQLSKHWGALWPAILISTIPFIIWDSLFTQAGYWGFTPRYLVGLKVFHLPIEEILFFICIPYACVFTYFVFRNFKKDSFRLPHEDFITYFFAGISIVAAVLFYDRAYTFFTGIFLAAFLMYLKFVVKPKWLSLFYYSHMFLLIPFIIVNGILTGTGLDEPIVWYNDNENVGIRFLTIPVEDLFYGMLMLLLNTFLFEKLLAGSADTADIKTVAHA